MYKNFLAFSFLLISHFANGQITIDQTDMPKPDSVYNRAIATTFAQYDFSTTGANNIWDFSGLDSSNTTQENYFNILKAPFTALITFGPIAPSNTRSQMFKVGGNPLNFGNIGGGFLPLNVDSTFEYYKLTASRLARTGFSIKLNGIPIPLAYDSNDVIYKLPLNYNNVDSGISIFEIDNLPLIDFLYYKSRTKRVNTVDGWGQLKLPNNPILYDVLRVKSEVYATDSIHIDTLIINQGFNIPRPKQIEYKWLAKGKGLPVLTVTGTELLGNFTVTEVRYLYTAVPLSINDIKVSSIYLYPNPTEDKFVITTNKSIKSVVVKNILGQDIINQNVNQHNILQLQAPSIPGVYSVQVLFEDGSIGKQLLQVQ